LTEVTPFSPHKKNTNSSIRAEQTAAFSFAFTSCERVGLRREESLIDVADNLFFDACVLIRSAGATSCKVISWPAPGHRF
jgi:hypothetical protein